MHLAVKAEKKRIICRSPRAKESLTHGSGTPRAGVRLECATVVKCARSLDIRRLRRFYPMPEYLHFRPERGGFVEPIVMIYKQDVLDARKIRGSALQSFDKAYLV